MNIPGTFALAAGMILIYAAVKNVKNPADVVRGYKAPPPPVNPGASGGYYVPNFGR